jgi:hypothetical protein
MNDCFLIFFYIGCYIRGDNSIIWNGQLVVQIEEYIFVSNEIVFKLI